MTPQTKAENPVKLLHRAIHADHVQELSALNLGSVHSSCNLRSPCLRAVILNLGSVHSSCKPRSPCSRAVSTKLGLSAHANVSKVMLEELLRDRVECIWALPVFCIDTILNWTELNWTLTKLWESKDSLADLDAVVAIVHGASQAILLAVIFQDLLWLATVAPQVNARPEHMYTG